MDSDSDSSNENEILPRRSRRLSTIIPASHWMSIGYSDLEAKSMENIMKDMNTYCEEGIDCDVVLRPWGRYSNELVVPYHEMMLPLWKRFSKALSLCTDEDYKVLYIKSVSMDIQVARLLSVSIMSSHLEMVKLRRCGMSNTSLLRTLLAGCSSSRIQIIDLEYNNITSQGAAAISDVISANPVQLQALFLNHNNFLDGDMVAFASALKLNTHLLLIQLKDNDITEQGWKIFQNAMFDMTSMSSLVDCNHTCILAVDRTMMHNMSLIDAEVNITNGNMTVNGSLLPTRIPIKKKIRRKVVLALCGINGELFDLGLLNDLPFQLMPRVLELIQEHTLVRNEHIDDEQLKKEALSRVFHTLRGWELPLLFDNLHGLPTRRSKRKRGGSSRCM